MARYSRRAALARSRARRRELDLERAGGAAPSEPVSEVPPARATLADLVASGRFRWDNESHRLALLKDDLGPLRELPLELLELVDAFRDPLSGRFGSPGTAFSFERGLQAWRSRR